MSHSRLQPKPTENNGKISLGFATSFSDLWGGLFVPTTQLNMAQKPDQAPEVTSSTSLHPG